MYICNEDCFLPKGSLDWRFLLHTYSNIIIIFLVCVMADSIGCLTVESIPPPDQSYKETPEI